MSIPIVSKIYKTRFPTVFPVGTKLQWEDYDVTVVSWEEFFKNRPSNSPETIRTYYDRDYNTDQNRGNGFKQLIAYSYDENPYKSYGFNDIESMSYRT